MALIKKKKCLNCEKLFRPHPKNAHHQDYCGKPECRKVSKAESQKRWLQKPENRGYFSGSANVKRVQEWRKANPGYSRRQYKNRKKALQANLELENRSKALQETLEPENQASLQEILEPENRSKTLQETFKPENQASLQEILESENRLKTLQDTFEPENQASLQEILEPENRSKTLQETCKPGKEKIALQDLLETHLSEITKNTLILQSNALQDLLNAQTAVLIGLIANITGCTLQDEIDLALRRMRNLGLDIVNNSTFFKGGLHDEKVSHPAGSNPESSKTIQLDRSPAGS